MSSNMHPMSGLPSSSGIVQSQSLSQPLEQLAYTDDLSGIDEQYIYVTYPSGELKKRLSDRYEKDILIMLANNDEMI